MRMNIYQIHFYTNEYLYKHYQKSFFLINLQGFKLNFTLEMISDYNVSFGCTRKSFEDYSHTFPLKRPSSIYEMVHILIDEINI